MAHAQKEHAICARGELVLKIGDDLIHLSLNTSSTGNKVDTANDKCTFAGKLADGNYVWSVTENGTTVASGSFTLDRGI